MYRRETTYCLQRLSESCILYLHTVHSSRRTTFLVVFAYVPITIPQPAALLHPSDSNGTYLLVEDGLSLATVTRLLTVVTTLSLRS